MDFTYGFSAIFLIGLTSISSTVLLFTKPAAIHAVSPHRVTRPTVTAWSVCEMFVLSRLCQQQMPCHSERALIWRFNIAGNNETYLGLVKWLIFLSDSNQILNFSVGFRKSIKYKILQKSFLSSCDDTCGQKDGWTDGLGAWYHFSRREGFYWDLMLPETIKLTQGSFFLYSYPCTSR
jgi:hypothetical protein